MMGDLLGILDFDFMRHALAAGLLASLACGVIGSLVVVNRLVFLAGGVAHAAYGGVGLAFALGWPVLPCAVGFSVLSALGMAGVSLRAPERADAVIGAMWAGGMAFGVILLDLTPGYNADLMSFLFGSILAVPGSDLAVMAGLDAVILALTGWYYKDLLAMSYDREFAMTRGVPVTGLYLLLMALTAMAVVMIIRVVGLILVVALMTIPPYLAERRCRSLAGMMLVSSLLSALFCLAGLALSYACDLTSGASIIAAASAAFGLSLLLERRPGRRGARRA